MFVRLEVAFVKSSRIMWFDIYIIVVAPVSLKERGGIELL